MFSCHKFLLVKCEYGFEYTCLVLYHLDTANLFSSLH